MERICGSWSEGDKTLGKPCVWPRCWGGAVMGLATHLASVPGSIQQKGFQASQNTTPGHQVAHRGMEGTMPRASAPAHWQLGLPSPLPWSQKSPFMLHPEWPAQ